MATTESTASSSSEKSGRHDHLSDRSEDISSARSAADFLEMSNVLTLAVFAAEARRVLDDIDFIASALPDVGERLDDLIRARRQWSTYEDTVPEVIQAVACKLEQLSRVE